MIDIKAKRERKNDKNFYLDKLEPRPRKSKYFQRVVIAPVKKGPKDAD